MDEPAAVGHAFNIANSRPVSQTEVGGGVRQSLPQAASSSSAFRASIMLRAGGHPMGPKMYFGLYLDMPPITQVTAKAQRVLKFKPTDFAAGLQEILQWYLRQITRASRIIRSKTCC